MKITLVILAILVALSYAENECKVFKCGSIDQAETGPQICAQKQDGDTPSWWAAECTEDGQFCQGQTWNNPTNAPNQANCAANAVYEWPINVDVTKGGAVDGDACDEDANCKDGATCGTDKVCKSALALDEACPANDDTACPRGHWCGEGNKCAALLTAGTDCTRTNACELGTSCVALIEDGTEQQAKCVSQGSLANGVLFVVKAATHEQVVSPKEQYNSTQNVGVNPGTMNFFCSSYFAITNADGQFQCRTADKTSSRTTDQAGQDCEITQFVDDADITKESTRKVTSLCGFNKDNKAYCPLQVGDEEAQDWIKKGLAKVNGLDCHRASFTPNPTTGSICAAYKKAAEERDEALFFNFRIGSIIGDAAHQEFANTANNDKCVANSITLDSWKGFGDAYLSFSVVGMLATVFAYILM